MRTLLLLLALLLIGCVRGPDVARFGSVRVGLVGCLSPYDADFGAVVQGLDQLGGPAWRPAYAPERPDVTVRCADFLDRQPGAAHYRVGSDEVEVDPERTLGLTEFAAATRHELVHWRIDHGPHPERALLHVCASWWDRDRCWDGGYGLALMNPDLGAGAPFGEDWVGGDAVQAEPTFLDGDFLLWALSP
jgi:hypothetical protein